MNWRPSNSDAVLKAVGVLLVLAAILKGYQLVAEPVANDSIWTFRPFLILQVEFELALGIWLLSGCFAKAACVGTFVCFLVFSFVTLYKGLTGVESCGCFGLISVSPWITLLVVDLPVLIALGTFRPKGLWSRRLPVRAWLRYESVKAFAEYFIKPVPSPSHFVATAVLGLGVLGATALLLVLCEPAMVTSSYEVLRPGSWVGRRLPILRQIDIVEKLKQGTWLVLFHRHDCPDCHAAVSQSERMARDLEGNEDLLRIALIEVPPYGPTPMPLGACTIGKLADAKEWFVAAPTAVLMMDATVKAVWESQCPDLEQVIPLSLSLNRKNPSLLAAEDTALTQLRP
jgi:Methylamine utilisation protein MauE